MPSQLARLLSIHVLLWHNIRTCPSAHVPLHRHRDGRNMVSILFCLSTDCFCEGLAATSMKSSSPVMSKGAACELWVALGPRANALKVGWLSSIFEATCECSRCLQKRLQPRQGSVKKPLRTTSVAGLDDISDRSSWKLMNFITRYFFGG